MSDIIPLERGVFEVTGSSGAIYRVDMTCFAGQGQCSCPDFRIRKQPGIEAGGRGDHLHCRHILAVREWIVDELVKAWLQQEQEPT